MFIIAFGFFFLSCQKLEHNIYLYLLMTNLESSKFIFLGQRVICSSSSSSGKPWPRKRLVRRSNTGKILLKWVWWVL
jgi:hypothetical protein